MTSEYLLRISDELVTLIRNLHPVIKSDIRNALRLLTHNPDAGKPLKDELDGLRSYRMKQYRVIYRVPAPPPRIIEIVAIGPRKTIYEATFNLISSEHRAKKAIKKAIQKKLLTPA